MTVYVRFYVWIDAQSNGSYIVDVFLKPPLTPSSEPLTCELHVLCVCVCVGCRLLCNPPVTVILGECVFNLYFLDVFHFYGKQGK